MKKKTWYRLDNAAKIYPPISSSRRPGVFALSAVLTEKIDKDILGEAVNVVLHRFPSFKVRLKRGIFWYYLEENKKPFYVAEEPPFFLQFIDEQENNDYLFKVFYLGNKITLTIFHALTDGTGGMEVLKAIVFEYLLLKGKKIKADNELKTIYSPVSDEECEDNFLQVYDKNTKKPPKEYPAYKLSGTAFNLFGAGIITGTLSTVSIKELAKKHDTTITTFIAGLILHIIYQNYIKDKRVKNKNVRLLIPVNMRKFYRTSTVRNFALFVRPGINFDKEYSLKECIAICDEQIKKGSAKEVLDGFIASHVKTEKNFALKLAPLFIKDLAMKIAYTKVGEILHTSTISNLGIITLPESVKKYVTNFLFSLGVSYTARHSIAISSYEDKFNISFSRDYVETNIERDFFRYLTNAGIEVQINSNYWEDRQ